MYKNDELLTSLKKEQTELLKKIEDKRKSGDYGTYKNLINALKEVVYLIERYDREPLEKPITWELKYSNYKTDDNIPMISVWEQNDNGEIKNTKQFRLYDEKLLKMIIKLLNQIDISDLVDEQGHPFKNNKYYSDLINYLQLQDIKNKLFGNDNGSIYIDNTGVCTVNGGTFTIKNDNVEPKQKLYFDVDVSEGCSEKVKANIYYNDGIYNIMGNFKFIAQYIYNLIGNKSVEVYGDYRCFGMSLVDELKLKEIEVMPTRVTNFNMKRPDVVNERILKAHK